jgi:hypothetical protein
MESSRLGLGLVRLEKALYRDVQLGFYPHLSTPVLFTEALVLTSDWIEERLRLRVA